MLTAETTDIDMLIAQAATPAAGGVVAVPVVLVILVLIFYLCRRKRHKISTALLGFVAGTLLAGTTLGAAIAAGAVQLINDITTAIGGPFR